MSLLRRLGLSNPAKHSAAAYRADIDGLRTLAVAPVVLYHAGLSLFPGGYVGVDVFFVISGFLITSILRKEMEAGRFSLLDFYERRARRIMPALMAMLAATFAACWVLLLPADFALFGKSVLATLLFVANLFYAVELGDYFSEAAELHPLLHTWSLAVEEQFYLFFPLLLIVLLRRGRRTTFAVLGALFAASLIHAEILAARAPTLAFYVTTTRIWELGIGALLALGVVGAAAPRAAREGAGALGLALIAGAVLLYDRNTPFPGLAALAPCLGAALLIWSGSAGPTLAARLLSTPPMVFVGLISYSLYLWHWPILAAARHYYASLALSPKQAAAAVVLSVVAATLSWAVVERPFRDRRRIGRRAVYALSGGSAALAAGLAGAAILSGGAPGRITPEVALIAAGAEDRNPRGDACFGGWPEDGLCRMGAPGATQDFLFWGDSHANALMPGMDAAAEAAGVAGWFAGMGSCPALIGVRRADRDDGEDCVRLNDRILAFVLDNAAVRTVYLYARWTPLTGAVRNENRMRLRLIDERAEPGDAEATPDVFRRSLKRTVDALRAAGREVVLIEGTPEIGWHVPRLLLREARWGATAPPAPDLAAVTRRNAPLMEMFGALAAADPGVSVVSLNDALCAPRCRLTVDGRPFFYDDDHISAHAARTFMAPLLAERLWGVKPENGT